MRIGQTSFVVFISQLLGSILGFVATLYFARILGAEILGFYALVVTSAKWVTVIGEVGVASALMKRISEGETPSEYFTAGIVLVGALGLVSSLVIVLFRDEVNTYIGVEAASFIVVLVLVGLFSTTISAGLKGERLVHLHGILTPVRIGSRSLIQIALVLAGFELAGMLVGYAAGGIIVAVIGTIYLSVGIARPRIEHFQSLFEFAKYSWLGNLRVRAFNDLDIIVLGAFVSPALVGIYAVAWGLTNFIGVFGDSIRQTTFPELSRAGAAERRSLVSTIVTDSLAFNGLIAFPGLFGSIVLADRVLRIYGDEFTRGATLLALLILAMLVYDYQNQLLNALSAIDRPDLSFRVNGVFVASNLVLNVVLILLLGLEGAALATALAASIGLILAFRYLRQIIDFDVPIAELGRQLVAASVMAVVVAGIRFVIEYADIINHNLATVILLVVLGAGIYFLLMVLVSERFRSTVKENSTFAIPFLS